LTHILTHFLAGWPAWQEPADERADPRQTHLASTASSQPLSRRPLSLIQAGGFWIHTRVSTGYDPSMAMKDAGIRIRVERELRDAFRSACAAENRDASEVLREFMRSFSEQRRAGKQASLFALPGRETKRTRPSFGTIKSK
jgi:hypothetical protein